MAEQAGTAAPHPDQDFRRVYEAGVGYVWESLRRLGVREADLEDATHDVFVAVHRKLAAYDAARPLRPWLFGFAFRVAAAHRRAAPARHEIAGGAPEAVDEAPNAEERLVSLDTRRLVTEALASVDLEGRAVFLLHDFDGHSIPEIAAALGGSPNTHYSRLRLARQAFAAAVRRIRLRRGEP